MIIKKEGADGVDHCNDCKLCVEKFDHHCPWCSKCIGGGNIYLFYCFLTCTIAVVIVMFFGFVSLFMYYVGNKNRHWWIIG